MSIVIKKTSEKFKEYAEHPNYRLRLIEGTEDQYRLLTRMVETCSLSIPKESVETLQVPLKESYKGNDYAARAIVRGIDVTRFIKNLNERVYGKDLWEKVMQSRIAEGSSSLTDHPADDDPGSVRNLFGIWHNFRLGEETGKADLYVIGEMGKLFLEAIAAGGKEGFSTVGYGEMKEDGITVNPDTYELERLADWVINPSQQVYATKENVIVETFNESTQIKTNEKLKEVVINESEKNTNLDSVKDINAIKNIKESNITLSESNTTNINNKITKERSMSEKLERINLATYKANLKKSIKEASKSENKKEAFEKICALKEEAVEALGVESAENQEVQETADEALETVIADLQSVVTQTKDELENIKVDMSATTDQKKDAEEQLNAAKGMIEELRTKYKRVLEIASNMQEEYSKLKEDTEDNEIVAVPGDTSEVSAEDIAAEGDEDADETENEEDSATITIGDDVEILINDPQKEVTVDGAENLTVEDEEGSEEDEAGEDDNEFELETEEGLEEAYKKVTEKSNSTPGKAIKKPKVNVKKLNKGKIDATARAKYHGTKKPSATKTKKEDVVTTLYKKIRQTEAELPYFARTMSTSTSSTTSHDKNFGENFNGMTEAEKAEYAAWKKHWNAKQEAAKKAKTVIKEADDNLDTEGLDAGADAGLDAPADTSTDMGMDMGTTDGKKDNVEINIKVPTKEQADFANFKKFLNILPKGKYSEKALKEAFKKYSEDMEEDSEEDEVSMTDKMAAMRAKKGGACAVPKTESVVYSEAQFLKKFGIASLDEAVDITDKVYGSKLKEDAKKVSAKKLMTEKTEEKPILLPILERYYNTIITANPSLAQIKEEIVGSKNIEEAKKLINEFVTKKTETTELFSESSMSKVSGTSVQDAPRHGKFK